MLYVLIADGELDQVCETKETADKERRDLIKMGCTVKIKTFANWQEVDQFEEKMRGY